MNKKLQLDRLDREILEVFATDHPRPSSIGYCDYDVSEDEVQRLCVGIDPYNDTKLIDRFSWHVTLGMFGESKDFPPFAGYVAVVSRREGLNFPNEYRFFQLHIGSGGLFSTDAKRVIGLWAKDILYP